MQRGDFQVSKMADNVNERDVAMLADLYGKIHDGQPFKSCTAIITASDDKVMTVNTGPVTGYWRRTTQRAAPGFGQADREPLRTEGAMHARSRRRSTGPAAASSRRAASRSDESGSAQVYLIDVFNYYLGMVVNCNPETWTAGICMFHDDGTWSNET